MKILKGMLKKNQVILYVIALMLITAGYLNYTTNTVEQVSAQTEIENENNEETKISNLEGNNSLKNTEKADINNETKKEMVNEKNNEISSDNKKNQNGEVSTDNGKIQNNEISADNNTKLANANVTIDEYFTKSKLQRDTMFSQMIETYEKVLNSNNSLETQKQSATEEINKINNTKNGIMICENLISTKGFEKNIIFVNGESISVVIGVEELKKEEVAQIQNIIARELKAEIKNIHISTKSDRSY